MFDFNKYSLKDYIDNAEDKSKPLFLGTSAEREVYTDGNHYSATQYMENGDIVKYYHNYFGHNNKELSVKMTDGHYRMHYILETFKEELYFSNFSYTKKITRKGEESFSRKTYKFNGRSLVQDFTSNEFIWYYDRHSFMQKINKNKTREYLLKCKDERFELRENYNSKGVCTRSLFFFKNNNTENCSIQIHKEKDICHFWCNIPKGGKYFMKSIVLNNWKDASILNLYDELNCFDIDLKLPHNELYDLYKSGLEIFRSTIEGLLSTEKYNHTLLNNMLQSIRENTKSYAEHV